METSVLWHLIQQWMDVQYFPVKQAQLAEKIGVSRSAVSQWKAKQARPRPEHLLELAEITGTPYRDFLDAMLADMGYLDESEVLGNGNAAPNTPAGASPALDSKRNAPSRTARTISRTPYTREREPRREPDPGRTD